MNLKDLVDKLSNIDKLEKISTQLDKKIPGEQPNLDPKADVNAMAQALNAVRAPAMSPNTVQQPQQTTEPEAAPQDAAPPEKKELQQKNKPGEPVGEDQKEKSLEAEIEKAKERVKTDPSYVWEVDSQIRDEIMSSMTPRQRNIANIQRNLSLAYAKNDQENIKRWSSELEKRKEIEKPADQTQPSDSITIDQSAQADAQTSNQKPSNTNLGSGSWYKGTDGDYTIQKGDTLSSISKRTGVPLSQLMKLNNIENPNKILAGAKLKTGKEANAETNPENSIDTDSNTTTASDAAVDKADSTVDTTTIPNSGFKFTPEQEKWLGNANRQDPNIISRMPSNLGPKPPLNYFTDPESQTRAREINQGNKNNNSLSNLFRSKNNVKPNTDTFGVDDSDATTTNKPSPSLAVSSTTDSDIDTLRHQGKNVEISNLMKAGTQKESILSLENVVSELLCKD